MAAGDISLRYDKYQQKLRCSAHSGYPDSNANFDLEHIGRFKVAEFRMPGNIAFRGKLCCHFLISDRACSTTG